MITPALARYVCPGYYASDTCCVCELVLADLPHVMWGCVEHETQGYPRVLPPNVQCALNSTDLSAQRTVIQQLELALARQKRGGSGSHQGGGCNAPHARSPQAH